MKKVLLAVVTAALLLVGTAASAEDSTIEVSGNTVDTSLGENGDDGWWFNRDSAGPYVFTNAEHSAGDGSLYAGPMQTEPTLGAPSSDDQKFVGELFMHEALAADTVLSFDYLRGDSNANQFYFNVYVNTVNDNKFYDCRYAFVGSGSPAGWATVSSATSPSSVTKSSTSRLGTDPCPTTLAGWNGAGFIRMLSVNVGQSNNSDVGVDGYLDNVKVSQNGSTTTYDFEVAPPDADSDGVPDDDDNCVDVANGDQADDDDDGIGDACEADTDDDGVIDDEDNCDDVANPGQEDGDADGLGTVCDDANDDGIDDTDPPTDANQCKKGGFATFNNPSFKNQGACVSYVNSAK